MKPRIYTDTSVIGGCLDAEFAGPSSGLFARFARGRATLVLSDLTRLELSVAPARVGAVLDTVPAAHREEVLFSREAAELAEAYLAAGVIGRAHRVDAQHIALATLERVDVLVSWNFKHIVNLTRIHGFNSVNLRRGLPLLEIRSPREVIGDGEADEADEG